ncbi:MAG: hypothetical protein WCE63_18090 [Acidobacteriaceae bacterium]
MIDVGGHYLMFKSPENGIEVECSSDLKTWQDLGVLALGQKDWEWARGRITAGFVLDARRVPGVGEYLMFFHGSKYPEDDPRGGFDNFASIGVAWSSDLREWDWPGRSRNRNIREDAAAVCSCPRERECTNKDMTSNHAKFQRKGEIILFIRKHCLDLLE